MDVTIVIVSYNVADLLHGCLSSTKRETCCEYEIIVVDNNSSDNSVDMIRRHHPEVILIENQSNVGFARANNQAFMRAKGRYVFILNPDTVILENAVNRLVGFMEEHPEAGACGPKVLNPDGSLQPNCHHFPTIGMRLAEHFQLSRRYPKSSRFGREFMTYWDYSEVREVDWITGCALMLRKEAIQDLGALDEHYFMYSEEADICYRLHRAGWKVLFNPGAEIVHYWGKSSATVEKEAEIFNPVLNYLLDSKYYFFRKHYGYGHSLLLKFVDFIFYLMVFVKNLFRRNGIVRMSRLRYASTVLSAILFRR